MNAALIIGELARRTGTKVETVRYYEKIGLLAPPGRTQGNYRIYSEADLARLSFIRRTRDLGFSIDQIRMLLSLSDDASRDCATVDAIASAHLAEIERKLIRSEEHTSELQSLMRISYAVFCLKKKKNKNNNKNNH